MAGPAFAAVLAQRIGIAVPFLALGGLSVATTIGLALIPRAAHVREESGPVGVAVRAAASQPELRAALAIMLLGGGAMSAVNLLIPLQLHANGISTSGIGLAYSASSAVFIAVSGYVARLGSRAVSVGVAGFVTSLVVASVSTVAIVAFLLLRAPISSTLFTIAYPLAGAGARRATVGRGAVMGLLNVVWALSTVIGPLLAGGLAQTVGVRSTYVVLIGLSVALGSAMLASRRRHRAPEHASA
ncbi:MAG: MFS transporter [Actinobacteria bacterium]|nr:MAG: MFS transporter [Actinomycetota bacterium]